ncbi:hypothetical protein WBK31_03940 [Nonomuraea sp. N2-4H]
MRDRARRPPCSAAAARPGGKGARLHEAITLKDYAPAARRHSG